MEREIICRDITLEDRMTVARLHFDELVPGENKPKVVSFTRDFILDDYKVKKVEKKYDKDGNLIHQNPVFLSGYLRGEVCTKICNQLVAELYPGRRPQSMLHALRSLAIMAARVPKNLDTILTRIDDTRKALDACEAAYESEQFSYTSLRFYNSTKDVLRSFGRGEGDETEEGSNDEI
jgi:hypothetical protein